MVLICGSAWMPNTDLTPLDPEQCKNIPEKGKQKQLIAAYKIAAENHDLQYFKNLLAEHQRAVQQEAEEREAEAARKAAQKAEKEARAAEKKKKRKSTADTDVEMADAEEEDKKSKSKKRKKEAESDAEEEKVIHTFIVRFMKTVTDHPSRQRHRRRRRSSS